MRSSDSTHTSKVWVDDETERPVVLLCLIGFVMQS